MIISNNFFKYAIYYPTVLLRGEWVLNHLKNLERTQYLTQQELLDLQLDRLNKLLAHAKLNVPFYSNLPISKLLTLGDLQILPFLEKDTLRNNADQLYSRNKGFLTRLKTTGGSTGAPVTLRKDSKGMAQELAATWRGYRWAGIDIGDKQARFWGIPKEAKDRYRANLIDWIAHRKRLSAFSFSERELDTYTQLLKKFKPNYFYGYVSMIREYAKHIDNKRCSYFKPSAIITTAEVLTNQDRDLFNRVFGCKVFNEYGCGELGTIAHECEEGSLHISSENMIVEIINSDGSVAEPGDVGEIVVTDLVNYSTPLIRYKLKDFASISKNRCKCGRVLPVLEGLYGREYDILINSQGKQYHAEFFLYMFEDLKKVDISVKAFQIIQNNLQLTIKVVCEESAYYSLKTFIRNELVSRFDSLSKINFIRVEEISRERSGKLRVTKRLE